VNGVTTKLEEWIHFLLGIGCLLTAGTIFVTALLAASTGAPDTTSVVVIIFAIYACLYSGFANLSKAGV